MGEECPPLLFHSFTSGPEEADRILSQHPEALFGINGVVTFKNAPELREAVAKIGIERILLETDSPYLAPVPKRGKRNESAWLPYVNDKIADILALSPELTEAKTDQLARRFFRIT